MRIKERRESVGMTRVQAAGRLRCSIGALYGREFPGPERTKREEDAP